MQYVFLPLRRGARRIQREAISAGWIVLACASLSSPAYAQASIGPRVQLDANASRSPVIRTNVHQVFIPATVTDSFGRPTARIEASRIFDCWKMESSSSCRTSSWTMGRSPSASSWISAAVCENKVAEARQAINEFLHLSSRKMSSF